MKSQQRSLSQDEIIDFAQAFDPQPYHMDAAAGDASIFGGLCASGWQVAAVATQLASDTLAAEGYNPVMLTEVSEMKWRKPTFVDQSLTTELHLGKRQYYYYFHHRRFLPHFHLKYRLRTLRLYN